MTMIQCRDASSLPADQALQLRQQADDLLRRLLTSREQCERRQAEAGLRDPMKFVTGQSALDDAIQTTRDMIRRMDLLLEELNVELGGEPTAAYSLAGSYGHHEQ